MSAHLVSVPPAGSSTTGKAEVVGDGGDPGFDVPARITDRTPDDLISLAGSALSSFLLVWVLFEHVLATSGVLAFVLAWFALFLVLYGVVLAAESVPTPLVVDRLVGAAIQAGAGVVALVLASAVIYTFVGGREALFHLNFFTQDGSGATSASSFDQGGIWHAIVGTLIEVGIAVLITLPLGVATAVFMTEVGGRLAHLVRTLIEAMTALPSIVAGLFIYSTVVVKLGVPKSGLAASLALAVMMLPIIARSADVVLRVVPGGLREAGRALGAPAWRVVWHVVLPTARSGLATALILGIARGIGETSPVLLTSGASTFLNTNPVKDPMSSLPLATFFAVRSPDVNSVTRGFATASVLMAIVLALFILTRLIARGQKAGR